jgi:hypothetical protein
MAQFEINKLEEIHKNNDHACDSARYFFSFMPDLTPDMPTSRDFRQIEEQHARTLGAGKGVSYVDPKGPMAGSWEDLMKISESTRIDDPLKTQWDVNIGQDNYY